MKDKEEVCLGIECSWEKEYASISPEIVQTSSFQFKNFKHYVEVNTHQKKAYTYTRGDNPTLKILEDKITKLEGGECARSFASGMGAISSTILSLVSSHDHVLIVNTVYGSSLKLIKNLSRFGVECCQVNISQTSDLLEYIQDNTKMIYFESPSSQKFEMLDLKWISDIAKQRHIYTVIDNTWATPLFQNPIEYGIDVVIHSCSKYIGGHSDIVGGIVISSYEIMKKIDDFGSILLGATMSPMNAWLAIRGLRTLPTRLKQQNESIQKVIDYMLEDHHIEMVYHPYCCQKELSKTYLKGQGSLFSFVLKDANESIIETFIDSLKYFTLAYSWGGFESLVMPVFKGDNEKELKERGLAFGHIRMYIGLEDVNLLIKDIQYSLDKAYGKDSH